MQLPIQTRYAALAELELDAASAARWLSARELIAWQTHQSADRKNTWLAGRVVAKRLILAQLLADASNANASAEPSDIDIDSRSAAGKQADRPLILLHGQQVPWALSIAHTARGVLVALAPTDRVTLGVDLVPRDSRDNASLAWCLTADERRWRAEQPNGNGATAELWAVKEALYKACQTGEGFAPAQIEMLPGRPARYPLPHRARAVERVQCWRVDGQMAALAVAAA